jgi:hypothetical protein
MNSPIELTWVRWIFKQMRGRFGSSFVNKFKSDEIIPEPHEWAGWDKGLYEAMKVWAHELRGLTKADIEHGLNATFKGPPSSDEFKTACLTGRNYAAMPHNRFQALPAPKLTVEQIAAHMDEVRKVTATMSSDRKQDGIKTDWAYKIADEVQRGVYCGGIWCKRIAADAIQTAREDVPEALRPFLTISIEEE